MLRRSMLRDWLFTSLRAYVSRGMYTYIQYTHVYIYIYIYSVFVFAYIHTFAHLASMAVSPSRDDRPSRQQSVTPFHCDARLIWPQRSVSIALVCSPRARTCILLTVTHSASTAVSPLRDDRPSHRQSVTRIQFGSKRIRTCVCTHASRG